MPVLKNSRWEAFAQALFKGQQADEAYVQAGYKHDRGHASRLASTGIIRARIQELHGRLAERAILSKSRAAEIMSKIVEDVGEATREKISAAKLVGQWYRWETGTEAEHKAAEAQEGLTESLKRLTHGA